MALKECTALEVKALVEETTPVLVFFGASWCAPCQNLSLSLDPYAETVKEKLHVVKVDVDYESNLDLLKEHAVKSVPTLVLYRQGETYRISTSDLEHVKNFLKENGI